MIITVINDTGTLVSDDELLNAIRAVNRQIDHDFRPYWHLNGELRLGGVPEPPSPPNDQIAIPGDAIIYVQTIRARGDDAPMGLAGHHYKLPNGLPVACIYVDPKKKEDWSLTLSHEALELVADPLVNLYVRGPHPDRGMFRETGRYVFHAYEVCDAVQGEYYLVDGYKVSNFLLPLYFTVEGQKQGRIVFQGRNDVKRLASFGVNPGGYIPFYDPNDDQYHQYYLLRDPDNEQLDGRYLGVGGRVMGRYETEILGDLYPPGPAKPSPKKKKR